MFEFSELYLSDDQIIVKMEASKSHLIEKTEVIAIIGVVVAEAVAVGAVAVVVEVTGTTAVEKVTDVLMITGKV